MLRDYCKRYNFSIEEDYEEYVRIKQCKNVIAPLPKAHIKSVVSFTDSAVCNVLQTIYPNLSVMPFKNNTDMYHVWVKGGFMSLGKNHINDLPKLNKKAKDLLEGDNFSCTSCKSIYPISEREEQVFAGHYCKGCYTKYGNIKSIVDRSRETGFYD